MKKNIAVKAAGFKQRSSNSIVTETIRGKTKQNHKSKQPITKTKQKNPQQSKQGQQQGKQNKTKKHHHFSVRHNYPGSENAVQTLKIFILYLGNSTSNKNLHSIGAISSLQEIVHCLFFLPIICYCSVRDDNTKTIDKVKSHALKVNVTQVHCNVDFYD